MKEPKDYPESARRRVSRRDRPVELVIAAATARRRLGSLLALFAVAAVIIVQAGLVGNRVGKQRGGIRPTGETATG